MSSFWSWFPYLGGAFQPDSPKFQTELGFLYFEKPEQVPCLTEGIQNYVRST
jgi:hypothetical protein